MSSPVPISLIGIAYPPGYFDGQSPVMLDYVCARHGTAGPGAGGAYRWCELGCGSGLTAVVLAAANPGARFVGIDLDAAAIEAAHRLATEAELTNVEFHCADICDLEPGALGQFEYITVHGLFSWVAPRVRAAIAAFMGGSLRPEGLAYVSYNTVPGWAALTPLRDRFRQAVLAAHGEPLERAEAAIAELRDWVRQRAPYFEQTPQAARYAQVLAEAGPAYALHELLSEHWEPMSFAQVSRQFQTVGLSYVGTADPIEDLDRYALPDALAASVQRHLTPVARELERDFLVNRFFRRDVYRKPGPRPDSRPVNSPLLTTGLASSVTERPAPVLTPRGREPIAGEAFEWIRRVLQHQVLSVAELMETGPPGGWQGLLSEPLEDWLSLLVSAGELRPCRQRRIGRIAGDAPAGAPATPAATAAPVLARPRLTLAANRVLLERALGMGPAQHQCVLASPLGGAAIALDPEQALVLRASLEPDPLTWLIEAEDSGLTPIARTGGRGGQVGEQDWRELLERSGERWLTKLRQLGVIG